MSQAQVAAEPHKSAEDALERLIAWMRNQGWTPLPHQREAWSAILAGRDGLVLTPTGSGKTYALYLAALAQHLADPRPGTTILYVTPLRALTRNIAHALARPVEELELDVQVEDRTGDTSSSKRQRMRRKPPTVLVTTPESLSLMMTYADAPTLFASARMVVVDEWHSLLASKRGTLLELTLSRIRAWAPELRVWGLSATLGNAEVAARHLLGANSDPILVRAALPRGIEVSAIIPESVEPMPWSGHLGMHLLAQVVEAIDIERSTLVFTNTRSQAERWFAAICQARPEWFEYMGLHHGSIDRDERERVERELRDGVTRLVVCTASLDLGIDVGHIEHVVQIGSPRSVARLLQRAGRSGHRPGETSRILCVPTHGIELIEVDALRHSVAVGRVETIEPPIAPIDVLTQHIVSCALGPGFEPDALFRQVRTTATYARLSRQAFDDALAFASTGGPTLQHYDQFERIQIVDGVHQVTSRRIAQLHRMNIGTIASAPAVTLKFRNGRALGTVEESFLGRLLPQQSFLFQGRALELVRVEGVVAYVKSASKKTTYVPRWGGGLLPFSRPLGDRVRERWLEEPGEDADVLDAHVQALIEAQAYVSARPDRERILVEHLLDRAGHHLFLYPFEGFLTNEAFGTLLATRISRDAPATIAVAANEYGVALYASRDVPLLEWVREHGVSRDTLAQDIREACNVTELAKRRFFSIARTAGLVLQNMPGKERKNRQLLTSSNLIFDVLQRYDPGNLLLAQAEQEVLDVHFDVERLTGAFARAETHGLDFVPLERPSPLAFPLMVERVRARVSRESLADRIRRMKDQWTSA